jgi:hypothetical protein
MIIGFSVSSYISGLVKTNNYNNYKNSKNNYATIPFQCGLHPKSFVCSSRQGKVPKNKIIKNYTQNKGNKN